VTYTYACDCCSEPSSGKMTRENSGKLGTASSSPVSLSSSPVPPHTMQTRSSTSPTNSHDGTTSMAGKSHWGPQDEAELIQALSRWNDGATSSNAMYKEGAFRQAAEDINRMRTKVLKGAPKTADSCKSKWSRVRISFLHILSLS